MARKPRTPQEASKFIPEPEYISTGPDLGSVTEKPADPLKPTPATGRTPTERANRHAIQTQTSFLPKEEEPDIGLDFDPSTPVMSSGEEWDAWVDRRFSQAVAALPKFGPKFALEVATSPITDEELQRLMDGLSRAAYMGVPRPKKDEQFIQGIYEDAIQSEADAISEIQRKFPGIDRAAQKELRDLLADNLSDAAVRELQGDPIIGGLLGLTMTQEPTVENLLRGIVIGRAEAARAIEEGRFEDLQEQRPVPKPGGLGRFSANVIGLFGRGSTQNPLDPETIEGTAEEFVRAQFRPSNLDLLLGGLEEVYHAVSIPVGTALSAGVDATRGDLPNVGQRFKQTVRFGPGRSIAISAGLRPETAPFDVMSGTLDLAARWFLDPANLVGEAAAGAKLAGKVPGTQAAVRGMRGRFFKMFAAKTPEEFVGLGPVKRGLDRLWGDVQKVKQEALPSAAGVKRLENLQYIVERHNLPIRQVDRLVKAESREQMERIFLDGMYGRLDEVSITEATQRIDKIDQTLRALDAETVSPLSADDAAQLRRGLEAEKKDLLKTLKEDRAPVLIRAAPESSHYQRMKAAMKRPDRETPWGRRILALTDKNWANKLFNVVRRPVGRVPTGTLDLTEEGVEVAARDLAQVGRIYGLPQNIIDEQVTKFARATSAEERYGAYAELLGAVDPKKLPKGQAQELTGFAHNPAGSIYASKGDEALDTWKSTTGYNQPLYPFQVAEAVPFPNLREVIKARSYMGRVKAFLEGRGYSKLSQSIGATPGVNRAGEFMAAFIEGEQRVVSAITNFFTPLYLLRFGWPLRVLPEEMGRLAAVSAFPLEDSPLNIFAKIRGRVDEAIEVPEEMLARYGALVIDRVPTAGGMVARSNREYWHHLAENLRRYSTDETVRHILTHGADDTASWLFSGAGKGYLQQHERILRKVLDIGDGPITKDHVRAWVQNMEQGIEGVAGTNARLRESIRTGRLIGEDGEVIRTITPKGLKAMRLDGVRAQDLQKFFGDAQDLAKAVPWGGSADLAGGPNAWNRGIAAALNFLGSKPTNYLNRAPAFKFFYRRERERLLSIGVADDLADQGARRYGIEQVGRLLYDASERTATDVLVRNLIPFFPAWKEVLQRWLVTIPAEMGWGVGHAVMARRAKLLFDALLDEGVIGRSKDSEGNEKFVFANESLQNFFGTWLGIKGLKGEVPVSSINMLGNWPSLGPVPETLLATVAPDGIKKFVESFQSFGIDANVGPAGIGRILMAVGIKPPWDVFGAEVATTRWSNFVINVLRTRTDDLKSIIAEQQAIAGLSGGARQKAIQDLQKRYQDLWDDAHKQAQGAMLRWGLGNLVWPVSPRLLWPGEEEAQQMRDLLEQVDEATERRLFTDWLDEDPLRELQFIGKTYQLAGEREKDQSLERYFADVAGGLRVSLGREYPAYAAGAINFTMIRARERQEIAGLGSSWADIMQNHGSEVAAIREEARRDIQNLLQANPTFRKYWEDGIRKAQLGEGEYLPAADEELAREAFFLLKDLEAFDFFESDVTQDLGKLRGALGEVFDRGPDDRLPKSSFEAQEMAYYKAVQGYYDEKARIFESFIGPGHTDEERRLGRQMLGEFQRAYEPPTVNGQKMPHPEVMAYYRLDEGEKAERRRKWALGKLGWLSAEQREVLGLKDNEKAEEFWSAVYSTRDQARAYVRKQGWVDSQREAVAIYDAVDAWEREVAAPWYGMRKEYQLSQEPVYKRLEGLDAASGKAWKRITQVADAAHARLQSLGLSQGSTRSKAGFPVYNEFVNWLESYRRSDIRVHRLITNLHQASFLSDGPLDFASGGTQSFYEYLFFGRGD